MADKELSIINKVELRIALAGDEILFQNALNLYLVPLLLKLASPYKEVQEKVVTICHDLITRVNSFEGIGMPWRTLLDQMKKFNGSNAERSALPELYSIVFLKRAIVTLSDRDLVPLLSGLINGFSSYPSVVVARIFELLTDILSRLNLLALDAQSLSQLDICLADRIPEADQKNLLDLICKFLMLQPCISTSVISMPGLSASDVSFFMRNKSFKLDSQLVLAEIKINLLIFVNISFEEKFKFIPYLIASCDLSSKVNEYASRKLSKTKLFISDREISSVLLKLFLGSVDQSIPPVKPSLQNRILELFLQSEDFDVSNYMSDICEVGLSSDFSKLRRTTIEFIRRFSNFHTRKGSAIDYRAFHKHALARIKHCIFSEGWPKISESYGARILQVYSQRQLLYEVYCVIIRNEPELLCQDFSLLEFLFQSLENEDLQMWSTIQEGLSSLSVNMYGVSEACKNSLKALVTPYLSASVDGSPGMMICRFVGLKLVNAAFDFYDAEARFLCLLGRDLLFSDEVRDEALKGLDPYMYSINYLKGNFSDSNNVALQFPRFELLLGYYFQYVETESTKLNNDVLNFFVKFLIQTLVMQATFGKETAVYIDENWESAMRRAIDTDKTVRLYVKSEIGKLSKTKVEYKESTVYELTIILALDALLEQLELGKEDESVGEVLAFLLSFSPADVDPLYSRRNDFLRILKSDITLKPLLNHIGRCAGVVFSHPNNDKTEVDEVLTFLVRLNDGNQTDLQVLSTAHIYSRLFLRKRQDAINEDTLRHFIEVLAKKFKVRLYDEIALNAVYQLSIFNVFASFPLIKDHGLAFLQQLKESTNWNDSSLMSFASLKMSLIEYDDKSNPETLDSYEEFISNTYRTKQVDSIFVAGEAFVIIAGGWSSRYFEKEIDIQDLALDHLPHKCNRFVPILKFIMNACNDSKPLLNKAGCIWLLSLVQYCGNMDIIQRYLLVFQSLFMRFLSHKDEFIQDAASRGLAVLFDLGANDVRENLIRGLVKTLAETDSSKMISGAVSADTELFEPGAFNANQEMVTVYRDVLNLASDVGDPSLVYKFMSLAKSSALCSSHKGAAFGLGSILTRTSLNLMLSIDVKLKRTLIAKLFRCRFDPFPAVATAMNSIWNSLVNNESEELRSYFEIILIELLKDMNNKEWRIRQSAAVALNHLIQISSLQYHEKYFESMCAASFRIMDDIKDSVRKEGEALTKTLASEVMRIVKKNPSTSTIKAHDILNYFIPFLLGSKGLLSDAEEVRVFSLRTLLRICDVGGPAINQFVPLLLSNFITAMSSMEPEAINYLVLNADKFNLDTNELDSQRISNVGKSSLMQAIEDLLSRLTEDLMPEIINVIKDSISKSVGLPSKICGSRVLVILTTKHMELTRQYGNELLAICIRQTLSKSNVVMTSYATAAGYVCRLCSVSSIIKFSKKIEAMYFESGHPESKITASVSSLCVSKYSGEMFTSVLSAFLPLAFIGKHDSNNVVAENFEREWSEYSVGMSSLHLYFLEISDLLVKNLGSQEFEVRVTLSKALLELSKGIGSTDPSLDDSSLLLAVIECMKGRYWRGKETLLESLVHLAICFKKSLNKTTQAKISDILVQEANRKKRAYRIFALLQMGEFIRSFNLIELLEEYTNSSTLLLINTSNEAHSDEEVDDDSWMRSFHQSDTEKRKEKESLTLIGDMLKTVSRGYPTNFIEIALERTSEFINSTDILSWQAKLQLSISLDELLRDADVQEGESDWVFRLYDTWTQLLEPCLDPKNIERVKIIFSRFSISLYSIIKKYDEVKGNHMKTTLLNHAKNETSSVVSTELEKVRSSN